MIRTGSVTIFENADDFSAYCESDPYGRGFVYNNRYPIKPPSKFPAAFKYEADWDPHFIGSYVEIDLETAIFAARLGLESDIRESEKQLAQLNSFARSIK